LALVLWLCLAKDMQLFVMASWLVFVFGGLGLWP
jgi:hypothetical protein